MAYADTLRQAVFNPSDAADLIEGCYQKGDNSFSTGTQSTTSNVTLNVASVVTVTDDDIVEITGGAGLSCSTINHTIDLAIQRNGVDLHSRMRVKVARSDNVGADRFVTINFIDKPGAGTYTYTLILYSVSGSTVYSRTKYITTKIGVGEA